MRNLFKKASVLAVLIIAIFAVTACGGDAVLEGEFVNERGADYGVFNFTGDSFTFTIANSEILPELPSGNFTFRGNFTVNDTERTISFTIDEEHLMGNIITLMRVVAENEIGNDPLEMDLLNFIFDEVLTGNASRSQVVDFAENLLLAEFEADPEFDDMVELLGLEFFTEFAAELAYELAYELYDIIHAEMEEMRLEMLQEFEDLRVAFTPGFARLMDEEETFVPRN